jgi:ribose/xylose/arabinose/galactoside ABC-type transport system permease subunit
MKYVGTYMLWPFGIFDGQLIKVMAIWHILWSLGTFFLVLLCCTYQNKSGNPARSKSTMCDTMTARDLYSIPHFIVKAQSEISATM